MRETAADLLRIAALAIAAGRRELAAGLIEMAAALLTPNLPAYHRPGVPLEG